MMHFKLTPADMCRGACALAAALQSQALQAAFDRRPSNTWSCNFLVVPRPPRRAPASPAATPPPPPPPPPRSLFLFASRPLCCARACILIAGPFGSSDSDGSTAAARRLGGSWTTAVFFRDPIERFLSAYTSKCLAGHDADSKLHCYHHFGGARACNPTRAFFALAMITMGTRLQLRANRARKAGCLQMAVHVRC